MLRSLFIAVLFAPLLAGCRAGAGTASTTPETHSPAQDQRRFVENNVFTSTYLPPIRIRLDPAFTYVGGIAFLLKDLARVERYVFIDADLQRHIRRLVIFQFEGFLEGVDEIYRYRFTDPVLLGGYP